MIGIYFSGTGNSKFCLEYFLQQYDKEAKVFSIEEENVIGKIKQQEEIIFSYPVQYSNIPKILKDFINQNQEVWKGKKVFVIATMGLFSGDGAGILARLLQKYGAEIIGGLHLRMPDSISDEKVLKRSLEENKKQIPNGSHYVRFVRKGYAYVEIDNKVVKIKDTLGNINNYVYIAVQNGQYIISLSPIDDKPKRQYNRKKKD